MPEADIFALRAKAAVGALHPGSALRLTALGGGGAGQVWRVKLRGQARSYVVKLLPESQAVRVLALQARHAALLAAGVAVPAPVAARADLGAFVMQDMAGLTLRDVWAAGAGSAALLTEAGRWLAQFHRSGCQLATFDPAPHLNWLRRALWQNRRGERVVPRPMRFRAALAALEARAAAVAGAPCRRAVIHRDLHLGNLLVLRSGALCGLDFENTAEDFCLRDEAALLLDAEFHAPDPCPADQRGGGSFSAADRAALALGYADTDTAPALRDFFFGFHVLKRWAYAGDPSAHSAFQARALARAMALAEG